MKHSPLDSLQVCGASHPLLSSATTPEQGLLGTCLLLPRLCLGFAQLWRMRPDIAGRRPARGSPAGLWHRVCNCCKMAAPQGSRGAWVVSQWDAWLRRSREGAHPTASIFAVSLQRSKMRSSLLSSPERGATLVLVVSKSAFHTLLPLKNWHSCPRCAVTGSALHGSSQRVSLTTGFYVILIVLWPIPWCLLNAQRPKTSGREGRLGSPREIPCPVLAPRTYRQCHLSYSDWRKRQKIKSKKKRAPTRLKPIRDYLFSGIYGFY